MTKHIKDKQKLMNKIETEYSVDTELLHDLWDLGYDRGFDVWEKKHKTLKEKLFKRTELNIGLDKELQRKEKEIKYYQREIENLKRTILYKIGGEFKVWIVEVM